MRKKKVEAEPLDINKMIQEAVANALAGQVKVQQEYEPLPKVDVVKVKGKRSKNQIFEENGFVDDGLDAYEDHENFMAKDLGKIRKIRSRTPHQNVVQTCKKCSKQVESELGAKDSAYLCRECSLSPAREN